jgi:hypothetical protein
MWRALSILMTHRLALSDSPLQHLAIPYYDQPNFVVSPLTNNVTAIGQDDLIDVVFLDFALSDGKKSPSFFASRSHSPCQLFTLYSLSLLEPQTVVRVLNAQQSERIYQVSDAAPYNTLNTQDLYKLYAIQSWN